MDLVPELWVCGCVGIIPAPLAHQSVHWCCRHITIVVWFRLLLYRCVGVTSIPQHKTSAVSAEVTINT